MAVGDQPRLTPWAALPGRLELLTSSVERCRSRRGRIMRARRARLHYVEREDPGDGHPQPPGEPAIAPARYLSMPSTRLPATADPRQPRHTSSCRSKNPSSEPSPQNRQRTSPVPLDRLPLTLVCQPHLGSHSRVPRPHDDESGQARLTAPASDLSMLPTACVVPSVGSGPCLHRVAEARSRRGHLSPGIYLRFFSIGISSVHG